MTYNMSRGTLNPTIPYPTIQRGQLARANVESAVIAWQLTCFVCTCSQEARLSQRGRAMLYVIEYFAESLKVTQGHSK